MRYTNRAFGLKRINPPTKTATIVVYNLREYGTFETEARNSLSEFKKDVDDGLNQLQIVSEQLKETADERRSFQGQEQT